MRDILKNTLVPVKEYPSLETLNELLAYLGEDKNKEGNKTTKIFFQSIETDGKKHEKALFDPV